MRLYDAIHIVPEKYVSGLSSVRLKNSGWFVTLLCRLTVNILFKFYLPIMPKDNFIEPKYSLHYSPMLIAKLPPPSNLYAYILKQKLC